MIGDIKAKLPGKKKAKSEEVDDEENVEAEVEDRTDPTINLSADATSGTDISNIEEDADEDDAPKSIVDKLKAKFAKKKSPAASADKKGEKKKINPVILIVVVGGLGALFLLPDEEPVAPPVVTAPKSKRTKPKPVDATKEADPAVAKTETQEATTPDPTAAVTTPTETPADPTATVTPDPVVTETPPVDPTAETPVTTEPPVDEPVVTDTPIVEDPTTTDPLITAPTDTTPVSIDSVDGQVATDESSMTDKILEDLEKQVKKDQPKEVKKEYVSPPDYEYRGRGLVYNCAGKHWACVDAPSYKTCEDNFSSVTFKKKTIECYPFNVYLDTKGCTAMQNRVVSSNAKTTFCKGN